MERALIVRQPWIDKILNGEKVWEMRSRPTNITGPIGLIEQGTGLIVGEGILVGTRMPIQSEEHAEATMPFHKIDDLSLLKKWRYPWLIEHSFRYENPVPYKHPKGAVTWVRI